MAATDSKTKRGGARPGTGPKPYTDHTGAARTERVELRLTPDERERYYLFGGHDWLRGLLCNSTQR